MVNARRMLLPRLRGSDGGVARSCIKGVRDRCEAVEEADIESSVRARCSRCEDAVIEAALFRSLRGGKVVVEAKRRRWWCSWE